MGPPQPPPFIAPPAPPPPMQMTQPTAVKPPRKPQEPSFISGAMSPGAQQTGERTLIGGAPTTLGV